MIQDLTSLSVLAPSAQQRFPLPKYEFIIARARAAIEELDRAACLRRLALAAVRLLPYLRDPDSLRRTIDPRGGTKGRQTFVRAPAPSDPQSDWLILALLQRSWDHHVGEVVSLLVRR
jgi:hypothetical protein